MTHAAYHALASDTERHFASAICLPCAVWNVPVVQIPKGIAPDRAAEIAEMCGARMGGVAVASQGQLFEMGTSGEGTLAAL